VLKGEKMKNYLTFGYIYKIINDSEGRQDIHPQLIPKSPNSNGISPTSGRCQYETITGIIIFLLLNFITYINISNWTMAGVSDIF
jgi:hypothetical protein